MERTKTSYLPGFLQWLEGHVGMRLRRDGDMRLLMTKAGDTRTVEIRQQRSQHNKPSQGYRHQLWTSRIQCTCTWCGRKGHKENCGNHCKRRRKSRKLLHTTARQA